MSRELISVLTRIAVALERQIDLSIEANRHSLALDELMRETVDNQERIAASARENVELNQKIYRDHRCD